MILKEPYLQNKLHPYTFCYGFSYSIWNCKAPLLIHVFGVFFHAVLSLEMELERVLIGLLNTPIQVFRQSSPVVMSSWFWHHLVCNLIILCFLLQYSLLQLYCFSIPNPFIQSSIYNRSLRCDGIQRYWDNAIIIESV